jgi:hypothetical protein
MKADPRPTKRSLDTAVVRDARQFASLEEEWHDLYRHSPRATPFGQRYDGTHVREEQAAGIETKVVELSWREYDPREVRRMATTSGKGGPK